MSSLYRCRVRVGYKPYNDDRLIVFEDNQIADAEVVLKWDHSALTSNTETITNSPAFYSSLSKSTCRVTINDPYLSGIAWPLLYDAASLYITNGENTAKSIMFPQCRKGQDPIKDRCRYFPDFDPKAPYTVQTAGTDNYPHLLVSMWYDVKGTKFGTDFYFRVVNMNINHGSGQFPSVQIMGEEARSIIFNQNLVNYGFPEGTKFEDAIEKIVKDYGYTPSFCAADYTKYKLEQPTHIRDSGVTPAEAIKRRLIPTGGNFLSLPTREWADKVSICTRNEVNQGCKVFYLGVGLYEGYTIDGVPNTPFASNLEGLNPGSDINNFSIYQKPFIDSDEYLLSNSLFKKLREASLKKLKRNPFPGQFQPVDGRQDKSQATSSIIFEIVGPTPDGANTIVKRKSVNNLQLFGVSPNGTESISYFDGLLRQASSATGRVVILTKYFLYACGKVKDSNTQKCFSRPIYQEITNLSEVNVQILPDRKNLVSMGQVIGKSTKEKPDYVRFFIKTPSIVDITVPPEIVYQFAIPEGGLTDAEVTRYVGEQQRVNTPSAISTNTGLGPQANAGTLRATVSNNAPKILIMAGHSDWTDGTRIEGVGTEVEANRRALRWIEENASRYGIQNFLEFYKTSIPVSENSPTSQFSEADRAIGANKQVIELHHDRNDSLGKSGVIPPYSGKNIYPLDAALASIYGNFGVNYKDANGDTLGIPRRGGTILEIAPFTRSNAVRALSRDKATSDEYFRQALEPFMLTVRSLYSSNPTAATPQPGQLPPERSGDKLKVGLVGNTGRSSAPHLHVQYTQNKGNSNFSAPITVEEIEKYVEIQGFTLRNIVTSPYGPRSGGFHGGIDFAGSLAGGEAVFVKGGVKIIDSFDGCQNGDPKCNGKFGNTVVIETPDKKQILLAHLAPGSVSPQRINGQTAGSGSASGSNRAGANMGTGPTAQGLHIATSFKGVPRALRIIPGRTILSFITDYENWLREGKPRNIDPGVWIPDRFSKYFIKECTLNWRGDLRVTLRGVIDWGYTQIQTPPFSSYVEEQIKSGAIKVSDGSNGYFNYIRSLGDLCYKVGGKDSCETVCAEVQKIQAFLNANQQAEQTRPDVTTNYAPGPCRYNGSALTSNQRVVADAITDALFSAGVRTQEGFAGVLGNARRESVLSPSSIGRGMCERGRSDALGLFQWCASRRKDLETKCGNRATNLQCQLEFFVKELKGPYSSVISALNNAKTPEDAAEEFRSIFERSIGDGPDKTSRKQFARQIYPGLKCNRT